MHSDCEKFTGCGNFWKRHSWWSIEEYARHNGHADLIRELLDGSAGW